MSDVQKHYLTSPINSPPFLLILLDWSNSLALSIIMVVQDWDLMGTGSICQAEFLRSFPIPWLILHYLPISRPLHFSVPGLSLISLDFCCAPLLLASCKSLSRCIPMWKATHSPHVLFFFCFLYPCISFTQVRNLVNKI